MPDIVGVDTLLAGDPPEQAANFDGLATFAGKTQTDWENQLTGAEDDRWGENGLLGGLFMGLEQGKPYNLALLEALLEATIGGVEEIFDTVDEVLQAITDGFSGKWLEMSGTEKTANKGQANGYVPLNGSALIDSSFLPSYVDDVLEYADLGAFPAVGTSGLIYVALDTNDVYRWTGSTYVRISDRVAATGITDSTTTGRAVITATDAAAARTAIGAGTSSLVLGTTSTTAKAGDYQPASTGITDSTVTGRALLTATDVAAAKTTLALQNVDNTSDATKDAATSTLTNKTLTTPRIGTALLDTNGNRVIQLAPTASAVNYLYMTNAAAGNTPVIAVTGASSTIGINLDMRGTGGAIALRDGSANIMARFTSAASVVNYVQVSPATTGNAATVSVAGSDTNANIAITPKGTGTVDLTRPRIPSSSPPADSSANGTTGQIAWDADYLYVCTAGGTPGTWKRAQLETW